MVCLTLFLFLMITSPGEERASLYASRACVCLFCIRYFPSFFSSSWCHVMTFDFGVPWNFRLLSVLESDHPDKLPENF